MNNWDLYQLMNFVSNKDRQGSVSFGKYYIYDGSKTTKYRLSTIFVSENRNLFDYHLRRYNRDWKSRKALQPFLREKSGASTSGSGSVSYSVLDSYAMILEMRSGEGRPIEVVDDRVWYDRLSSTIKAPSTKHPIARLKGDDLEIRPSSVSAADIIYLKYPEDPFIDGYYDGNDNFIYLEEGQTVSLGADETALDGTSGTSYSSRTTEMEYYDEEKLEVLARVLGDLGISINKSSLVQYSQKMQQED